MAAVGEVEAMTERIGFYPHSDALTPKVELTFESSEYGWWTNDIGPMTLAIIMAPIWDLMAGAFR